MALPLPPGLTPPEVAFICEMEMVTVIPRQRLEGLNLLGGSTPPLNPPYRTPLPLWLALLLKRQRRASILPPPWLSPASLKSILETENGSALFSPPPPLSPHSTISPPFLASATADAPPDALPYHWVELGEMLLDAASDDLPEPDTLRRLMRDLREVRMAKMRAGVKVAKEGGGEEDREEEFSLNWEGVNMNGVGGMEVCEGRAFIGGVVDGLRRIGASREMSRREKEQEEREGGIGGESGNEMDL